MAKNAVSLRPADMVSGGVLRDVDGTVVDAKWAIYDFQGKAEKTCLALSIKVDGTSADAPPTIQYWSAFAVERYIPDSDDDDRTLVAPAGQGSSTDGVNKDTNLAELVRSLVTCGFPEDKLMDGDTRVFIGMHCHWLQKKMHRAGLDSEGTVLTVSKIHALPGETSTKAAPPVRAAAGKSTATATAKTGVATPASNGASASETALDMLVQVISAEATKSGNGLVLMQAIARANNVVAKSVTDLAMRKMVSQALAIMVKDDEVLASGGIVADRSDNDPNKHTLSMA